MAAPSRSIRGPGTRSGSTSGAAVRIRGLDEFRKELRKLDDSKDWAKQLGALHRALAKDVAGKAQSTAEGMGGIFAHFAPAIRGYGSAPAARVGITGAGEGQRYWGANAAFWGVKDNRTGWNEGGSSPNIKPDWVGSSWDAGVAGQGPYAINETIAAERDRIVDEYGDAFMEFARRAFPDQG